MTVTRRTKEEVLSIAKSGLNKTPDELGLNYSEVCLIKDITPELYDDVRLHTMYEIINSDDYSYLRGGWL